MVTQAYIQHITQMLNEPGAITDRDMESVESLVATYPYFIPGRYLEAVQKHKTQPITDETMAHLKLYMSNWVLFWELMQKGTGNTTIQPAIVKEPLKEEKHTPAFEEDRSFIRQELVEEKTPIKPREEVIEVVGLNEDPVDETLIQPVYTEDYFLHQGIEVSNEIPEEIDELSRKQAEDAEQSLMVVMSFSEWLMYFRSKHQKEKEEEKGQKALKSMWQKEKLAAALEEENDEIPENVFEMAMNSITNEEDLVSESLADIYIMQQKYDKAIEMYKKLSLRNPQKSAYFARKIESIIKEKES